MAEGDSERKTNEYTKLEIVFAFDSFKNLSDDVQIKKKVYGYFK